MSVRKKLTTSRKFQTFFVIANVLVFSAFLFARGRLVDNQDPRDAAASNVSAFPGAEGFGRNSKGGRGGEIVFVTNTNPDGPGSLRAAIEKSGPRIVVFKTGGTIELREHLYIDNPYITIAGQTAPGDGIQIEGAGIFVGTHDVVIRGMRVRVGDDSNGPTSTTRRGIALTSSYSNQDVYDVIVDNSSISWGVDTNVSNWTEVRNVTFQYNIISEGLYCSIHVDEGDTEPGCHSMGAMLGSEGSRNLTFHHNLFAHNGDRNPRSVTDKGDIINNLIYNWKTGPTLISSRGQTVQVNVIGNVYIPGSDTRTKAPKNRGIRISDSLNSSSRVHIKGNIGPNREEDRGDELDAVFCESDCRYTSSPPFTPSVDNIQSPDRVYDYVLQYAGARVPERDRIDNRIVNNVQQGTGRIIDSQDEVGGTPYFNRGIYPQDDDNDGIPTQWERDMGLNPNDSSDANDTASNGYTWIEVYINSLIEMPDYVDDSLPDPVGNPVFTSRVRASRDDAEQYTSSGRMVLYSSDLELIEDGNEEQVVGIRFRNVEIPKDATIVDARIEFTVDETDSKGTTLYIRGQDSDNPPEFVHDYWNLSGSERPRTDALVIWNNIDPWNNRNAIVKTPDLKKIVQEIVNRSRWEQGNAMVFIIKGEGKRVAKSYNGSSDQAPKLMVEYRR